MAPSLAGAAGGATRAEQPILVLGASGAVGGFLIERLRSRGVTLLCVSRRQPQWNAAGVLWLQQDLSLGPVEADASVLVSLGPARHALDQVCRSRRLGRVVALSSASTLFKSDSPDHEERALMAELNDLEQRLEVECNARSIDLTLIKATMIYGSGSDANVARVAGLLSRLGLAPYCGRGLRQPVHADDLAALVVECLARGRAAAGTWLVGGGESLSYPAMLNRIASATGRHCRLVPVPGLVMKTAVRLAHWSGRLRDIRPVMIDRQRRDLVVDDQPARENLGWRPRPFRP
jgi:nucleoside-diphosphate-sugar epimerase